MQEARTGHTAVVLKDGRVLVAGGTTSSGITNTAEIYDAAANSWTPIAGGMTIARTGHTASVLSDGRVLIAGGQSTSGATNILEVFSPATGSFSTISSGTLSSPRQQHAAAVLQDGRVLIAGGSDGTNPLNTSDLFDPSSGSISAGPKMSTARADFSATTLLDGKVLVAGGNNGLADLALAEIYDPDAGTFSGTGSLAVARSGHLAFLLPNNNEVLIAGGTSAGAPLSSAELFVPWAGSFSATGAMATTRSAAAGSALKQDGQLLVAGGTDGTNPLVSGERYGFATVKTDAADYPPGTTVNISGSGWQPGETVTLTLVESPLIDTHGPYTAVADGNGNISNSQFVTDSHDASIRFYLTAKGSLSQAQNTFTDAVSISTLDATCTTPTVNFNLDQTVCTKATGLGGDTYVIKWFDGSNTLQRTSAPSSAGNLQDAYQPGSSGTWTVEAVSTSTLAVAAKTTFTVAGDNSCRHRRRDSRPPISTAQQYIQWQAFHPSFRRHGPLAHHWPDISRAPGFSLRRPGGPGLPC